MRWALLAAGYAAAFASLAWTLTDQVTPLSAAMSKGVLTGIWMRGHYLCARPLESSEITRMEAYDATGRLEQHVDLRIPGATILATAPRRFARAADGTWAVSGVAYDNDNRSAGFLAILKDDGRKQTLVQTSPYVATAVTIATDGTIWTAGSEDFDRHTVARNYNIIRRFDQNGTSIGEEIPRDSIDSRADPASINQLLASRSVVGWYSRSASIYLEFSLKGRVLTRTPVVLPPDDRPGVPRVATAALCNNGELWVSYWESGKQWLLDPKGSSARKEIMKEPSYLYGCDEQLGLGFQVYATHSIRWIAPAGR